MYWLALYLPTLPLEAVDGVAPDFQKVGQQHPIGVLDQGRLLTASAEVLQAGAHVGMTLAAVSSLVPGMIAVPRQPQRELELLHRLALAYSGYTPSVVIESDGVRLELGATLRLFGGRRALLRRLEATAGDCGIDQLRFAQASSPKAASLLARVEQGDLRADLRRDGKTRRPPTSLLALTQTRLDSLPLNIVLPLWSQPRALVDLLQGIGCRTLSDLRALPRGGLTRRGGRQLMSLVARAYGDEPDPQVMFEAPPTFELGLELMHRADEAGALVFAAQRLVQPLAGWLAMRWLAASRLSLKLRHETSRRRQQPDSILEIAMAQPSRDAGQIMLLLRERLQRMTLTAPVYAIVLRLDDAVSHAGSAGALWASPTTQRESDKALVDRLSARLGTDQVQRVLLCSDHRPERAMRWVSAQNVDVTVPAAAPATPAHVAADPDEASKPRSTAPRPTWLLAEPLPLRDQNGTRPVHQGKPLVIISRAERIEAGWFDDALASRDYHIAASDDACYWIYRERRADAPARWFLHGIFG